MGILTKLYEKIDHLTGFTGYKSGANKSLGDANYAQLNNGIHTYNYETDWLDAFKGLTSLDSYFTPKNNLKCYYENVPFLADCVNIYADIASQVRIQEIDSNGDVVENSQIIQLLEQPNAWQDQISFIKELVINTLCTGINIQYGDFFKNGNLNLNPSLYNLEFNSLKFPKIKNPYTFNRKDIDSLMFKEVLEEGRERILYFNELAFIYDMISRNTYGEKGFNSSKFLNPISRITSLEKDLQVLTNTSDTMAFLSGKNVNWIASKKNNAGQLAPLGDAEKMDIETKLSGNSSRYGARMGKSDVIATNEELSLLNLTRDNRKMQMIEMQNNAKENIRVKFGIPRDLLDAYTGTNSGSTYENQQFAEARFTLNNVKNITDSWLYSIENKEKMRVHFKDKGHKLIGTYEHMPSIIAVNAKLKNEGFKAKSEALIKFFEAFEKSKGLGIQLNYEDFLMDNGFEQFLKTQSTE